MKKGTNRQRKLFRARIRKKQDVKLRRATKDCGQCDNLLRHWLNDDGGRWALPTTRCTHKGRGYLINGHIYMVLCVCCISKMKKKTPGMTLKETM